MKKRLALIASFGVGLTVLLISLYVLVSEINFIHNAAVFDTAIVEVRREFVAKGKGSVLAYVPSVTIWDASGRNLKIKVETFSEEPVYKVGDKIQVLCNPPSLKCTRNNFADKWGDFTVAFLLSLMFLTIPLFHYWRGRQEQDRLRLGTNVEGS